MRMANRWSVLFGGAGAVLSVSARNTVSEWSEGSVLFDFCSGTGTAVATAACSCVVLVLEPAAEPLLGGELAVFAAAVAVAAGLPAGRPDVGGSTFAAAVADFAAFVARWSLSRTCADDGFSAFAATVDLIFIVAELASNEAGLGSIG